MPWAIVLKNIWNFFVDTLSYSFKECVLVSLGGSAGDGILGEEEKSA